MNNSQELIKQAKKNEEEIEKIGKERDKLRDKNNQQNSNLKYEIYEPQIKKLEKERDDKVRNLDKKFEEEDNKKKKQQEELYKEIERVKRIIRFLMIQEKSKERDIIIKKDEIRSSHHYNHNEEIPAEWLDYLYNDDFLKLRFAIIQNSKPKNKYSLIVFGKSIFYDDNIIKWGFGYYRGNERVLKDSSSIEELKVYLTKNKDNFLKEILEEYQEVKKEYLEIINNYSLDDFKEFEIFSEFRSLDNEEKEKIREDYLKSINETEWDYDRDRDKEEEFYDNNKEKYNFKILEIHNERFY